PVSWYGKAFSRVEAELAVAYRGLSAYRKPPPHDRQAKRSALGDFRATRPRPQVGESIRHGAPRLQTR
ncbi:MAG: hypothetical protein KJ749_05385, partial [Planctomycetes bacterium]|nr:hypothetical protein [Planctomycetota bacterium]